VAPGLGTSYAIRPGNRVGLLYTPRPTWGEVNTRTVQSVDWGRDWPGNTDTQMTEYQLWLTWLYTDSAGNQPRDDKIRIWTVPWCWSK